MFQKYFARIFQLAVAVCGLTFAIVLFLPAAFAAEGQPSNPAELIQQCVDYFVKGTPVDWILGGVLLLVTILGLFFRASVLSIIRDVVGKILATARKN